MSDYISALALIISSISLYLAIMSFRHSKATQKKADQIFIDSEKNELLKMLSDNKSLLNKARIEIGALKADFEIESQPVKTIMNQYTNIFTTTLPMLEDAIYNLEELHNNIHNWKGNISHKDIIRHKAEYYEDMKGFEVTYEQAVACTTTFKEKLFKVKQHTTGATK